MSRKAKGNGALVAALRPVAAALLEFEHDAAGLDAQFAGVPDDVPMGSGPEDLLNKVQARLTARFERLTGTRPEGDATAADARKILDAVGVLCKALALEVDVSPLPQKFRVWTGGDDYYVQASPGQTIGGVRYNPRFKFAAPRGLRLNEDGSLKRKKA